MSDIRVEVRDYTNACYYEEVGEVDDSELTAFDIEEIIESLQGLTNNYKTLLKRKEDNE